MDTLKVLAGLVFLVLVFILALFLPAGTLTWVAGWVYLVLFFSFVFTLTLWLFRNNPALLVERTTVSRSDQKGWDKVFVLAINLSFLIWLVLMPLDAVRFHWSDMPIWLEEVGAVVLVGSFSFFFLTFRENSYLSPVIRIQQEREHTVVSTGLYHYVRHPMYTAALFFFVGTSLLLGSWYGLLWGVILVGLLARRAVLEERTLRKELPGYDLYMTHVKYRLIPHVW